MVRIRVTKYSWAKINQGTFVNTQNQCKSLNIGFLCQLKNFFLTDANPQMWKYQTKFYQL